MTAAEQWHDDMKHQSHTPASSLLCFDVALMLKPLMDHFSYPADSVRKLHQVSVRTDLFISVLCWFTVPYNRWTDCEDHRCWRLVTLDVTNRRIWLWNWTRLLFETKRNQNVLHGFDVRRKRFFFCSQSFLQTREVKTPNTLKAVEFWWSQKSKL